jgi:hypothetical protein
MSTLIFDYGLSTAEVEGMTLGRLTKYIGLAAEHAKERSAALRK